MSHELRFTSPADRPVRLVAGLFYQRQTHKIEQNYIIDNIADAITVPGTDEQHLADQAAARRPRLCRRSASSPATSRPQLTADRRRPRSTSYENTLVGFFGYSATAISGSDRRRRLLRPAGGRRQSPCTNLDKRHGGHRLHPPPQPHLPDQRRRSDLRAPGRAASGPAASTGAARCRPTTPTSSTNYELGFKIELGRQPAALQRRDLPARLGRHPAVLPRRQRPHRDPQCRQRPHPRRRVRPVRAAGARPHAQPRRRLQRRRDHRGFLPDRQRRNSTARSPSTSTATAFPRQCAARARRAPGCRSPRGSRAMPGSRYEFPLGSSAEGHVQVTASHEGSRTRDLRPAAARRSTATCDDFYTVDFSAGIESGHWTAHDLRPQPVRRARARSASSSSASRRSAAIPTA